MVLAPVIKERKGHHQPVFEDLRKSGFTRARVNKRVLDLSEEIELDRYKMHSIEAVVDRLVVRNPKSQTPNPKEEADEFRSRLTDSIETALKMGNGTVIISDTATGEDRLYSENFACPASDTRRMASPRARAPSAVRRSVPCRATAKWDSVLPQSEHPAMPEPHLTSSLTQPGACDPSEARAPPARASASNRRLTPT